MGQEQSLWTGEISEKQLLPAKIRQLQGIIAQEEAHRTTLFSKYSEIDVEDTFQEEILHKLILSSTDLLTINRLKLRHMETRLISVSNGQNNIKDKASTKTVREEEASIFTRLFGVPATGRVDHSVVNIGDGDISGAQATQGSSGESAA